MLRAIELRDYGEESTITLIEFTYNFVLNQYGIAKIAEKKFVGFISSCLKFNDQSPRVKLFSRLVCLTDQLQFADMKLYLDIVECTHRQVLNFQILETDELPLIPVVSRFPPT